MGMDIGISFPPSPSLCIYIYIYGSRLLSRSGLILESTHDKAYRTVAPLSSNMPLFLVPFPFGFPMLKALRTRHIYIYIYIYRDIYRKRIKGEGAEDRSERWLGVKALGRSSVCQYFENLQQFSVRVRIRVRFRFRFRVRIGLRVMVRVWIWVMV